MKRALIILIAVGLVLPLTISIFSASDAQLTQTRNEISGLENNLGNAGNGAPDRCDSAQTANSPENHGFSNEQPRSGSESSSCSIPNSSTSFPDGAIYSGGEPPYAYIPTYDPKEKGFPKIPLEPEN